MSRDVKRGRTNASRITQRLSSRPWTSESSSNSRRYIKDPATIPYNPYGDSRRPCRRPDGVRGFNVRLVTPNLAPQDFHRLFPPHPTPPRSSTSSSSPQSCPPPPSNATSNDREARRSLARFTISSAWVSIQEREFRVV